MTRLFETCDEYNIMLLTLCCMTESIRNDTLNIVNRRSSMKTISCKYYKSDIDIDNHFEHLSNIGVFFGTWRLSKLDFFLFYWTNSQLYFHENKIGCYMAFLDTCFYVSVVYLCIGSHSNQLCRSLNFNVANGVLFLEYVNYQYFWFLIFFFAFQYHCINISRGDIVDWGVQCNAHRHE